MMKITLDCNVDSLRGFSEWRKTNFRIKTKENQTHTNNKFINQAENHRKEIVIVSAFILKNYGIRKFKNCKHHII